MDPQRALLASALAVTLLTGCSSREGDPPPEPAAAPADEAASATPPIVELTVQDFAFVAPPRLPSGWTTFRMTNTGEQPHFMILWQLPDDVTFGDYAEQLAAPFQREYDRYSSGELTQAEMLEQLGGVIPEWFARLQPMGGVGLTSPGRTTLATLRLEPGEYVMECYVLSDEDEQFHGTLGMLRPLIVTEDNPGAEPPAADIEITLSNYAIEVEGVLTAGEHTVAVRATDTAEGIVMHDVHLARLDPDASLGEVGDWMSWIDALRPPAPAEFLGGVDHLTSGQTGYFRVTLEPGRYAWVSELAAQGIVQEFAVE